MSLRCESTRSIAARLTKSHLFATRKVLAWATIEVSGNTHDGWCEVWAQMKAARTRVGKLLEIRNCRIKGEEVYASGHGHNCSIILLPVNRDRDLVEQSKKGAHWQNMEISGRHPK